MMKGIATSELFVMPLDKCRLCQQEAELQHSHVMPAFVFRWLRQSSGGGHLRASDAPNRRVQDGLKYYWLCSPCEERLSIWEGSFANKLFLPYTKRERTTFNYSSWLFLFCTSLSWRVLNMYRERNEWVEWPHESQALINQAELVWRDVLLGIRPHGGTLQQHLIPMDRIETATGTFAPSINRYLMRAVHMDLCRSEKAIYTYAKVGRFIILGFVHEPQLTQWNGTRVHANEGIIQPRKYTVPGRLGHYINDQARKMSESLQNMSDVQQAKVDEAFRNNVDNYIDSDAYEAMIADLEMFGSEAFYSDRRE